jgi:hypothetical protein
MQEKESLGFYNADETLAILSLSVKGELGADYRVAAIDLSKLTAREIASAAYHCARADEAVLTARRAGDEIPERVATLDAYYGELQTAFDLLQEYIDDEKITDTFSILAASEDPICRKFAGHWIGTLTRSSREYGLELWNNLLADEDPSVSELTWDVSTAHFLREDGIEQLASALDRDGITWPDLRGLITKYVGNLERRRGQ